MSSEVTAELIEDVFGKQSDSIRFANFCNSVVIAESSGMMPTLPTLSEKPGADGGMDGEWEVPSGGTPGFKSPFCVPGWNVFQYKARSLAGMSRNQAISRLCGELKGAVDRLAGRLKAPKDCRQYTLFTNLQLGLETATRTRNDAFLQKQRAELKAAIAEGSGGRTAIEIFDAAHLAAIVNAHPALRLTYFSGPVARSWNDAWAAENRIKDYKAAVSFVGRNQELESVSEWLADTTTKVIVVCGPSGMGKTRLALEATRPFELSTTVVEVVDDLLRREFQELGTSQCMRFIIVEDPTQEQVEVLAKRAVACEGIKLILTLPTDSKAPAPKLTEHVSIKVLPPLGPLSNADGEKLLEAAGATFDRQARDWILLQAGGNPEILLSAAELSDLRDKSVDLKQRLYQRFRTKIEKELGFDGIRALKILSPMLYVKDRGENSELRFICGALDSGIQPPRIIDVLPDLERLGYIRRRGNYVSVVPPLFAARLVEELALTQEHSLQMLFQTLGQRGRGRFLERMVTVDLPENSAFWEFIFGTNGPLADGNGMEVHFEHIESLARAVPAKTARFLESMLSNGRAETWKGHYWHSTLRELAYEAESCASGMRCLEWVALKEVERTGLVRETKLFCECFVDWYYEFPMSFQERADWVERLLKSEDRTHQLLAAHVVAFVTDPPQTLSGYAGGTARRLGHPPPRRMWKEIFDYMARLVEVRFDLTQSADDEIAQIARNDFENIITQLDGHLFPDQLLTIMERMVEWGFSRKLTVDVRKLRAAIHWIEERYLERSKEAGQEALRDKWAAFLKRLENLRNRYDHGNFLLRLTIGTGRSFELDQEDGEEGGVYGYQRRLRGLAVEVAANPTLMSESSWKVLKDPESHNVNEFLIFLGECDGQRHFLSRFLSDAGDDSGKQRFGLYCLGLSHLDPAFVDGYLDALADDPQCDKGVLLWPIRFIGPTPTNRQILLRFINEKSVAPSALANLFTSGRWLDDLPVSEVVTIMEFIAQGERWPARAAEILSLYLHPSKALPIELIPLGERILQEIEESYHNGYQCDRVAIGIAKSDLEKGFTILERQVGALNELKWHEWRKTWNPFRQHGGRDFWMYLRTQEPTRAYKIFCALRNDIFLQNEVLGCRNSPLDLEKHSPALLEIANANEDDAKRIADAACINQTGFFSFAFELLAGRPIDGSVALSLGSSIVRRVGFGTPLEKEQDALSKIDEQLGSPQISAQGRAWLERQRSNIRQAMKGSPWNNQDQEPLGWT